MNNIILEKGKQIYCIKNNSEIIQYTYINKVCIDKKKGKFQYIMLDSNNNWVKLKKDTVFYASKEEAQSVIDELDKNLNFEEKLRKEIVKLKEEAPTLHDFLDLINITNTEDMTEIIEKELNKVLRNKDFKNAKIKADGNGSIQCILSDMSKEELKDIIDNEENDYNILSKIYIDTGCSMPQTILDSLIDAIEDKIENNLNMHLTNYIIRKNSTLVELMNNYNTEALNVYKIYDDYDEYMIQETAKQINRSTMFNINWDKVLERY